MRILAHMLDRARPLFEKGEKLEVLSPLFHAVDSFAFSHVEPTGHAPYGRDALDVKRYMSMVIVALLPCVAASVYFFGWRILAMILVSYLAGGLVEVTFAVVRKEEISEGLLVTGLLLPLILPPTLPLWMVGLGCAFGVLVGKEVFGGTGRNPFNPALVGRCFLAIGYPAAMSATWVLPGGGWKGRLLQYVSASSVDVITSATALAKAKEGTWAGLGDLFIGHVPGCAGETSALAILAGGLFLLATRIISWRTLLSVLASFFLSAAVLHHLFPARFGPPLWHMLAGGFLFGAFFMATDPVSSPLTHGGKWLYGTLIGVCAVLIRNLTGYVEGVMFAILLGNIFAPTFDEVVCQARQRKLRREIV